MLTKVFHNNKKNEGFTLIELMIVMTIFALLMGLVGPLAIDSVEKAQAKQETLGFKNLLRKVSARAFYTGQSQIVKLTGKQVSLFNQAGKEEMLVDTINYEYLFFQPQTLRYNINGFVAPDNVSLTHRETVLELELASWVNGQAINTVSE